MNLMEFSTPAEMQAYIRDAVGQRLHVEQLNLGPGSFWVMFGDVTKGEVKFGRVLGRAELVTLFRESGSTTARAEVVADEAMQDSRENHRLYSIWHDADHVTPQFAVVQKADVWPIEARLHLAAHDHGYAVGAFEDWAQVLVDIAFRAIRAHNRSLR